MAERVLRSAIVALEVEAQAAHEARRNARVATRQRAAQMLAVKDNEIARLRRSAKGVAPDVVSVGVGTDTGGVSGT